MLLKIFTVFFSKNILRGRKIIKLIVHSLFLVESVQHLGLPPIALETALFMSIESISLIFTENSNSIFSWNLIGSRSVSKIINK